MTASSLTRGTVAAVGLIAIGFAGSTIVTPLYATYQARFGFSATMLTVVYAAYVLGNLGALLFLGRLSDRIGRRPVAAMAVVACAVAMTLFLAARGAGWLFVGRVVSGLAVGMGSGSGAAWLVDLHAGARDRATRLATLANLGGVGAAPLVAGLMASYAPAPLSWSFAAYGATLALVAAAVALAPETVRPAPIDRGLLRPRLALPPAARAAFVAPAATAFVTFGFVGFYAALLPSLLAHDLHVTAPAVGGAILAELFGVAMLGVVASRRLSDRAAMLAGLATILPGLALLIAAERTGNLAVLLAATALGGVTLALGYRGSLGIVNAIAPADDRAGLVSVYFVLCFAGNSLPVLSVGLATPRIGATGASELFAAVMAVLAAAGFVAGLRYAPSRR